MCWMCDHPEATFAGYVTEVLQPVIDRGGWAVQAVGGSRLYAPFSYTVGLTTFGLPELVLTGRSPVEGGRLLNEVADHLTRSRTLQPGERIRLGECLEVVEVQHPSAHLFVAAALYGDRVRALQLVWRDSRGRWPWDVGHSDSGSDGGSDGGGASGGGQPVLGLRAHPERLRECG